MIIKAVKAIDNPNILSIVAILKRRNTLKKFFIKVFMALLTFAY